MKLQKKWTIPSQSEMEGVTTMESVNDKKILTKYISSFLLGDGGLSRLSRANPNPENKYLKKINSKYYIKQRDDHEDYIVWQMNILQNITTATYVHTESYIDKRGYECRGQFSLSSRNHPFFTDMRNRLYPNNIKCLDPHYFSLFDWESLAIFYMDDGWIENNLTKRTGIYTRVAIASHSYSYIENKFFRDFVAEKFKVHFDVKQHKSKTGNIHYYLRCSKDNAKRFIDGVGRYILPSYKYKIDSTRLSPLICGG